MEGQYHVDYNRLGILIAEVNRALITQQFEQLAYYWNTSNNNNNNIIIVPANVAIPQDFLNIEMLM